MNTRSGQLKVLVSVIVWGASFVAIKIGLKYISPITLIWMRFSIGLLVLGTFVIARRQFKLPNSKDLLYFALLGFLGITFHQWLQSTGLITSQAITTGWIVASMPIFIATLGWLILKEKLFFTQTLGILIAAVGVLTVVSRGNVYAILAGKFESPGDILILLSAPNWAVFTILSRRGLKSYPAALMMFYVMTFSWLFSSALFLGDKGWVFFPTIAIDGWVAILFLGILCSGLAYVYWYDALKVLPASNVGAYLYLEPIVTVIISTMLIREKLTLAGLFGGIVILLGVWLVNRIKA